MSNTLHDADDPTLTIMLQHLCGTAARLILDQQDFPAVCAKIEPMLGIVLEPMGIPVNELPTAMVHAIATQVALEIWNHTPLPDNRFRPGKRLHPERNGPCPCGSGGKYKQCCGQLDAPPIGINEPLMLHAVLGLFPEKSLAELPLQDIGPEALATVAEAWMHDGYQKKAAKLLERYLANLEQLDGRAEWAADLLLNAYMDLNKPRKKQQLMARLKNVPDKTLRSTGWQRQATVNCDQGNYPAAWQAFREAQRLTPNAPALSHLEILLLVSEDRIDEAKARAEFWAARLRRDPDFDHSELIASLHKIANAGADGLPGLMGDAESPLQPVVAALADWPPVNCHYQYEHGGLRPKPALAELEEDWFQILHVENDPTSALFMASEEALAGQSFAILQDMIRLLPAVGGDLDKQVDTLGRQLLERSEQLREIVLRKLKAQKREFPWGCQDNRPMLTLLAWYVDEFTDERPEQCLELLRWSVQVANPVDNLGLRQLLIHQLIAAGLAQEAIAIAERYPNDFAATRYGHALALFAAGRLGEAERALRAAHAHAPRVWRMLCADSPRRPKPKTPGYIRLGTDEEAYEYWTHHRALWKSSGGLTWAAGVKLGGRKTPPAPETQESLF